MKRILVCCGGGLNGYPQAVALAALRQMAGKPLSDVVDLGAGTSIGGINLLIQLGMDMDSTPFFTQDGPVIFNKGILPNFGIIGAMYSASVIEERLQARFNQRITADLKTNLLVTSLDAVSKHPFYFRSFDTSNLIEGKATPLWKWGRATSAAQHYFPGFAYGNKILWDGGNVANNPAEKADDAADQLWGKDEPRKFLVLGCGQNAMGNVNYTNPSALTLLEIMVGMLFDAAAEEVTERMGEFYGLDYMECQPKFATPLAMDDASPRAMAYRVEAAKQFVDDNKLNFQWFLS